MTPRKPPPSEEEVNLMVKLYREGERIEDIARRFKTHRQKISLALKRRGINLMAGHKTTKHPDFSEQACLQWLKEHGFR